MTAFGSHYGTAPGVRRTFPTLLPRVRPALLVAMPAGGCTAMSVAARNVLKRELVAQYREAEFVVMSERG